MNNELIKIENLLLKYNNKETVKYAHNDIHIYIRTKFLTFEVRQTIWHDVYNISINPNNQFPDIAVHINKQNDGVKVCFHSHGKRPGTLEIHHRKYKWISNKIINLYLIDKYGGINGSY